MYGEENNLFTNKLGETITVEVKNTQLQTTELLTAILDGNKEAATYAIIKSGLCCFGQNRLVR